MPMGLGIGLGLGSGPAGASFDPASLSGAVGVWYADQLNTSNTRNYVPNVVSAVAPNLFVNDVTVRVNQWTLTGVATTLDQTDDLGGIDGVRCVCTGGSWALRNDGFYNFTAGAHTVVVVAKSNSGSAVDVVLGFGFSTPTTIKSIGTTVTRIAVTSTRGAGNDNPCHIANSAGADADITIMRWYVYEGSVDPYAATSETNSGHLLLGSDAKTKKPTFAANEADLSGAAAQMQTWLDAALTLGSTTGSFTAIACIRKTGTPGDSDFATVFASTHRDTYGSLGLFESYYNSPALFFSGYTSYAYRQPYIPGSAKTLFDPLNNGYNVWAWVYDHANTRFLIYLNDVPIAGAVGTPSTIKLRGLWLNLLSTLTSKSQWTSGAFYSSALTTAQLTTAAAFFRAKATANGLTLDTYASRFIYFEGDSNTDGAASAAPGGGSWPYLYKPNATQNFYGFSFALNGGKLADMVARAPLLARVPVANGRKFVAVALIGTNDGTTTFTADAATYSANLLAYWAGIKAAGIGTVAIGIPNRKDVNAAAGFDTWRKAINTNLRNAVGTQLDAFVDVETDANIGATNAPDNTTYFKTDKVHWTTGSGTTGQAALEVLVRATVNPLL